MIALYTNKHRLCALCEYWAGGNTAIKMRSVAGSYELVNPVVKALCRHPDGYNRIKVAGGSCSRFELRSHLYQVI